VSADSPTASAIVPSPTARPSKDLAIELVQADGVHLEQRHRLGGHRRIHAGMPANLHDVTYTAEQAVGDARRTA
jgi:hypothetical protein